MNTDSIKGSKLLIDLSSILRDFSQFKQDRFHRPETDILEKIDAIDLTSLVSLLNYLETLARTSNERLLGTLSFYAILEDTEIFSIIIRCLALGSNSDQKIIMFSVLGWYIYGNLAFLEEIALPEETVERIATLRDRLAEARLSNADTKPLLNASIMDTQEIILAKDIEEAFAELLNLGEDADPTFVEKVILKFLNEPEFEIRVKNVEFMVTTLERIKYLSAGNDSFRNHSRNFYSILLNKLMKRYPVRQLSEDIEGTLRDRLDNVFLEDHAEG